MALHETIDDGVATIVMDNPPVNALGIADTYALADLLDGYRHRDDVRSVVLTAEGRGFCAGVDIGEIQAMDGHEGLGRPTVPASRRSGPSTSVRLRWWWP